MQRQTNPCGSILRNGSLHASALFFVSFLMILIVKKRANIAKVESRGKSHLTMPRPKAFICAKHKYSKRCNCCKIKCRQVKCFMFFFNFPSNSFISPVNSLFYPFYIYFLIIQPISLKPNSIAMSFSSTTSIPVSEMPLIVPQNTLPSASSSEVVTFIGASALPHPL